MVNPLGDSGFSEEMIQELVEKMSEEDEGITFHEKFTEEDNEIPGDENEAVSLSEEELEEIVYDFQNFGMTMEEIDELIRTNSDDKNGNEVTK